VNGMEVIKNATGEYPVYPGHPLVIAYEILSVFQIDVINRSMEQPKNLDVKQLDYDALHKAGLLQH
jgi:hypothetical protein